MRNGLQSSVFFFWNSNRQMVSLRRLKFGGTPLHWPNRLTSAIYRSKKNPAPERHVMEAYTELTVRKRIHGFRRFCGSKVPP
jgi:hypothetical protein